MFLRKPGLWETQVYQQVIVVSPVGALKDQEELPSGNQGAERLWWGGRYRQWKGDASPTAGAENLQAVGYSQFFYELLV